MTRNAYVMTVKMRFDRNASYHNDSECVCVCARDRTNVYTEDLMFYTYVFTVS